jgi:sigma-E factor negative regulatory protein RseA
MNNEPPVDANDVCWLVSAAADGEADAAELAGACAAWAGAAPQARQRWHAYQLIGDVLRSDDLARAPNHDAAFLQRLSARLDHEPAVLAPEPLVRAPRRRARWAAPAALAAGVMALATVLVLSQGPTSGGAPPATLAAAPAAAVESSGAPPAPTQVAELVPAGGRVVRDAQLDQYLRAHRDYGTALPGSLPGGAGRSIATVSFDR